MATNQQIRLFGNPPRLYLNPKMGMCSITGTYAYIKRIEDSIAIWVKVKTFTDITKTVGNDDIPLMEGDVISVVLHEAPYKNKKGEEKVPGNLEIGFFQHIAANATMIEKNLRDVSLSILSPAGAWGGLNTFTVGTISDEPSPLLEFVNNAPETSNNGYGKSKYETKEQKSRLLLKELLDVAMVLGVENVDPTSMGYTLTSIVVAHPNILPLLQVLVDFYR